MREFLLSGKPFLDPDKKMDEEEGEEERKNVLFLPGSWSVPVSTFPLPFSFLAISKKEFLGEEGSNRKEGGLYKL